MTEVLNTVLVEDDRTGNSVETLRRAILDNLFYVQGKYQEIATLNDWYMALAYTLRDRILHRWNVANLKYMQKDVRLVCYMSAEFLMGPHLMNNIVNLGIEENVTKALKELDLDLKTLAAQEAEPGLGNGGLGRLAACYMDSMATEHIPAIGYGIRYEFGIFAQAIADGYQVELSDRWLHFGNPWEIAKPEQSVEVLFGGHTENRLDEKGEFYVEWVPDWTVNAVPYDTPILGYESGNANTLRLWKAEAPMSFDFQLFNAGDYMGSVQQKMVSENISKVLYPNDDLMQGKRLRLEQQFFFVSSSLQDMLRIHLLEARRLDNFHEKMAVQLNDTHPSIGIAELMRLLIDVHHMEWEQAWNITRNTFHYTNHTLLPEALEKWPLELFSTLLPRHAEIIFEINRRFLEEIDKKFPNDGDRLSRMSIIQEGDTRFVRMAHLACIGSASINGVAALHTELLKHHVLHDFYELWPTRFLNVTNGVTPRRWMVVSNPSMSELISDKIGTGWMKDLAQLTKLEPFAEDIAFRKQWREMKLSMKNKLGDLIFDQLGVRVDPNSMFDVQVKRMHEYKRQHLMVLHIIALFNRIKANPLGNWTPRTFIFGGKAAPGYKTAKLVIKLINSVGEVVNADPDVRGRLKVVFLPNFNVSLGQKIYPAADLSEQISTAGKEASGTGNMKFALNGAITIGTLDGANVEMREEVGDDNFFLFGLNAQEVMDMKASGYNPRHYYETNKELRQIIVQLSSGYFSQGDMNLFRPIVDSLLNSDDFMLMADFEDYMRCQDEVSKTFANQDKWAKMSILNVARMGKFSSDRAIREYAKLIWQSEPEPIGLDCKVDYVELPKAKAKK